MIVSVQGSVHAQPNLNSKGWSLLLDNKIYEAQTLFSTNTSNADRAVAGEAYRGLSEVASFLGDPQGECRSVFNAFRKDNDVLMLGSNIIKLSIFGRYAESFQIKEGYRVLQTLAEQPGPFCGQFQEVLAERYLADGKLSKATERIRQMGCIFTWRYIGPFENISHSGFATVYPPEQEIDFSKTYAGKDGNIAAWHELQSAPTSAWIFVEDHSTVRNAVNYFYCTVTIQAEQRARLAFGASGTFKIFLNGSVVLADSVFRNTGNDVFIQTVTLRKGGNALLVKLGHEWNRHSGGDLLLSNFSLRLLDSLYHPLKPISVSTEKAANPPAETGRPAELRPQPIIDSVVAVLRSRLKRYADDVGSALQLIHFYNGTEMTDESQTLVRAWLKKYPQSSLLHGLLCESLMRSKKYTEMEAEVHTAFRLSPLNYLAWSSELATVARSNDAQRVLKFIEQSPQNFAATFPAQLQKLKAYVKIENQNAAMECLHEIEKQHPFNYEAQTIIAALYLDQGDPAKAEKRWKTYLEHDCANADVYRALMKIAIKRGNLPEALDILRKGLEYKPMDASAYYSIANLHYLVKDYPKALENVDRALAIMPAGADMLNLKGAVLEAMGNREGARQAFTDAVRMTSDDFNAWENLRSLDKKPGLDSLASLPGSDAVIKNSTPWSGRTNENGAILSYISDIFYYPSHCSKKRTFLIVYLPTEHAIDQWKEYDIGFNSNFQTGSIGRALTLKSDGTQVPADIDDNQVVFKSLQPGDCILLEWSLKNYYFGEMAHQVWGSESFQLGYPVFDQRLRVVTPVNDTIPYKVWGDSVSCTTSVQNDYRITTLTRPPYLSHDREKFEPTDWAANRKVNYSTFTEWSQIVDWYLHLTAHIQDNTLELTALADSLLAGATASLEKARRIHEYITKNIRYSHVSFRQSGWIPQAAHDVVATRIGDCKDMASLGKILLQKAGIPSDLVLVNTYEHQYLDHAYIGPNFNHCILACTIDGLQRFIDFTDNNAALTALPLPDQAALGLLIRPGTAAPSMLPLDSAGRRCISRTVKAVLDRQGTFVNTIASLRTGARASEIREDYRYQTIDKRKSGLQTVIARDYPDVSIDTFAITNLDTLSDSLVMTYTYTAKNTVTVSGTTAIFPFHLPDALTSDRYPVAEKRYTPLDLASTHLGANTKVMHAELTIPAGWKPINLPNPVKLSSPYGTYSLEFRQKGPTIICDRKEVLTFYRQVPVQEYGAVKEFFNAVSKADAVQLVFYTK